MTSREADILEVLTRKVRILTLRQLVYLLHGHEPSASGLRDVRRWAVKLSSKGLVRRVTVLARPPLPLRAPVLTWTPGDPLPHFGRASHAIQSRWTQPVSSIPCVVALDRANRLLGGNVRPLKHPLQLTHDLGLTQVYLRIRDLAPALAARWVGEDELAGRSVRGARLPDAALCLPDGRITAAIEFGGAYSSRRLRSFHEACCRARTPYQLW